MPDLRPWTLDLRHPREREPLLSFPAHEQPKKPAPPAHRLRRAQRVRHACARPGRESRREPRLLLEIRRRRRLRNCGDVIMPVVAAGQFRRGVVLTGTSGTSSALTTSMRDLLALRKVAGESRWRSSNTSAARGTTSSRSQLLPFGSTRFTSRSATTSSSPPSRARSSDAVRGLVQCPADPGPAVEGTTRRTTG